MAQRVVFLITDLDLGGMPLIVRRIVRGLKESGRWEPTVVSIKPPGIVARWIRHEGVEVVGLNAKSIHDIKAVHRWVRTLQTINPAVVISVLVHANALAAMAAPLAGPRIYFQSIHTIQPEPKWHWRLQGLIARQCHGIITPSQAVLDRVSRFGRFHNGYVIPFGLDYDTFALAEPIPVAERSWPVDAVAVGYIGRFDPVKRLDILVREFAELLLRDYRRWGKLHLALIGYGPEEKPLRALAAQLGIASHVTFPGPTAEPARWYKALRILCMPSTVEGFGMNIIEAMACGTPVAVYRSPAVEEIVTDQETGLLIDPDRKGSMADAIAMLIENRALADKIRRQAQAMVAARYCAQRMVEGYQRVLDQAMAAERPALA